VQVVGIRVQGPAAPGEQDGRHGLGERDQLLPLAVAQARVTGAPGIDQRHITQTVRERVPEVGRRGARPHVQPVLDEHLLQQCAQAGIILQQQDGPRHSRSVAPALSRD
jgi:hypothetical protein